MKTFRTSNHLIEIDFLMLLQLVNNQRTLFSITFSIYNIFYLFEDLYHSDIFCGDIIEQMIAE